MHAPLVGIFAACRDNEYLTVPAESRSAVGQGRRTFLRAFSSRLQLNSTWLASGLFLRQRLQVDLAEKHLCPFRLEQNLAACDAGLAAAVDDLAIEDVGDLVAVADAFQRIPLTD